ncbi:hypothetical protein K469DRAFT_131472 [Zopfia rhizophila CBS 207.26]|uniref:Uncharacterized protein n=1 Tax=Zopfia rhizophila CBS 207.26 TaxID=1314779 RepID=A0A6A6EX16_9PEZI|nr:hypothetical protein K469DRAFT_131472 [Zopfia rhizophila CBS 207.26]
MLHLVNQYDVLWRHSQGGWKGKDYPSTVAVTLIQLAWIYHTFEAQESALSCPISRAVEGAEYKRTPYLLKRHRSNHSFPKILLAALLTLKMSDSEATVEDPTYQDMVRENTIYLPGADRVRVLRF